MTSAASTSGQRKQFPVVSLIRLVVVLSGVATAACGATHAITLGSTPSGAMVFNTDGRAVGRTPVTTTVGHLLPSNYMYDGRFNTEGYATFQLDGCEDQVVPFMEQSAPPRVDVVLRCAASAPVVAETWSDLRNWRRLRERMSGDEVRAILGEPPRVSRDHGTEIWFYPTQDGGVSGVGAQRTVTASGVTETSQEFRGGA